MNSAVTVVPNLENFVKFLEGLREYAQLEEAGIGILALGWSRELRRGVLSPADREEIQRAYNTAKLRRNEQIADWYHEAFRIPESLRTLNFAIRHVLPNTEGPFGTNNHVALDLSKYEKRNILNALSKLYGPCKPRTERLIATMVEYGTKIEMPPKDLLMCNREEDLRVWWNENNNEHINLLSIILDKVSKNHNKFYDVRHKKFRTYPVDHVVVFSGIESLLGFLVYLAPDTWNELGRSMAYHAACCRAGIPCGKEADYLPEGSDILKVMEQMKGLFVVPERYDPANTTLSGFFASTEIKISLTQRDSFHVPFGFLSNTHRPVATALDHQLTTEMFLLQRKHDEMLYFHKKLDPSWSWRGLGDTIKEIQKRHRGVVALIGHVGDYKFSGGVTRGNEERIDVMIFPEGTTTLPTCMLAVINSEDIYCNSKAYTFDQLGLAWTPVDVGTDEVHVLRMKDPQKFNEENQSFLAANPGILDQNTLMNSLCFLLPGHHPDFTLTEDYCKIVLGDIWFKVPHPRHPDDPDEARRIGFLALDLCAPDDDRPRGWIPTTMRNFGIYRVSISEVERLLHQKIGHCKTNVASMIRCMGGGDEIENYFKVKVVRVCPSCTNISYDLFTVEDDLFGPSPVELYVVGSDNPITNKGHKDPMPKLKAVEFVGKHCVAIDEVDRLLQDAPPDTNVDVINNDVDDHDDA